MISYIHRTTSTIAGYLSGVKSTELIVLDLFAEVHPVWPLIVENNKSFIWCLLHNYGGNSGIYGNITAVSHNPLTAKADAGAFFLGTGLAMEGTY